MYWPLPIAWILLALGGGGEMCLWIGLFAATTLVQPVVSENSAPAAAALSEPCQKIRIILGSPIQ